MKIEWTEPAVLDLESVWDYIRIGSEHFAARFVERILEAIENLWEFPEMGRTVPEADQENIPELVFHPGSRKPRALPVEERASVWPGFRSTRA